jgi:hypothetical protein
MKCVIARPDPLIPWLFTKSITFYGNPNLIHITSTPYIFKPVYCSPLTKG